MKAMPSKCWDAVVFDYGRVLSHAPTPAEVREFGMLVGVSEPPFFQLYSETRDEYDRGRHDSIRVPDGSSAKTPRVSSPVDPTFTGTRLGTQYSSEILAENSFGF